jgi:hypothetical protein
MEYQQCVSITRFLRPGMPLYTTIHIPLSRSTNYAVEKGIERAVGHGVGP